MTVEFVGVKNSHTCVLQVVNLKSQRKVFFLFFLGVPNVFFTLSLTNTTQQSHHFKF